MQTRIKCTIKAPKCVPKVNTVQDVYLMLLEDFLAASQRIMAQNIHKNQIKKARSRNLDFKQRKLGTHHQIPCQTWWQIFKSEFPYFIVEYVEYQGRYRWRRSWMSVKRLRGGRWAWYQVLALCREPFFGGTRRGYLTYARLWRAELQETLELKQA